MGGGGCGHWAVVACLAPLRERELWWRGLGVGVAYGRRGEREARWGSWEEGEVDMRQPLRAWWRPGEREQREPGPGGSWWRFGEREQREWVVEARWWCGECGRRGWVCRAGGERERRLLRDRALSLESGQSEGFGGPRGASRGPAWYLWGGGGPLPSMHPPRRGAVAAAAGGMGRVTVPGGVGPAGPPRPGRRGGGIWCLVWGGWPLVVSVVWGRSAWWLPSHTLVLLVHRGSRPGGVGWWAVVVSGGDVGGGGDGAAGGGGAGSGRGGAAGMALGPLVDILVPLVGMGGRASCAVPGAVLFGVQRGRVGGRA